MKKTSQNKTGEKPNERIDLSDPSYYNNRELSWLSFNERVLEEAFDLNNPLLERLKFLAIFSSNLDEFFMVRVAGLKDQVNAGYNLPENKAGLTPKQQLEKISDYNHPLVNRQYETLSTVLPLFEKEGVCIRDIKELSEAQLTYINEYFETQIYPSLTPMAIDAYHPFPKIFNKTLNLAVTLYENGNEKNDRLLAIVQIPPVLERFIELPSSENRKEYILIEDIVSRYVNRLFVGYHVDTVTQFRITRNADLSIHEEGASDLLEVIEKELKKRQWGAAVRLEIRKGWIDENILTFLLNVLEIHEKDVYELNGPIDLTSLFELHSRLSKDFPHLLFEVLSPNISQELEINPFSTLLKKDVLLHHPYDSFEPVVNLIDKAANDPKVLAIKQTLYRVSNNSPIIQALARAAENGKLVTVLVELKARFDEENNIQWAKMLEKAGVNIIFGMTSLKTHSKITLIVRKNKGFMQRFVHLGTGNYNDSTAKIYTDMGLLTTNQKIGIDATNFFNYLSGYRIKPEWNYFSISPGEMKQTFIDLIGKEIEYHKKSGNGKIIAKMNSLSDKELIIKLYEASIAGVKIELIIRGICCLRPEIPGVSENIHVRSIVGRFLEHTRIFYFHHGGEERIYLSSADMMTRNMEKRIEILFPILQVEIKKKVQNTLALILRDNVKARIQDKDGYYHYVKRLTNEPEINSQEILLKKS